MPLTKRKLGMGISLEIMVSGMLKYMALTVGIPHQNGVFGQELCIQKCPSFIQMLLSKALGLCREIPDAKVENTAALMGWAERWHALNNERRMSPTWSKRREEICIFNVWFVWIGKCKFYSSLVG